MNTVPISGEVSPPVAPTTEGACITWKADAQPNYSERSQRGKRRNPTSFKFRAETGQEYAHKGKVGRVLRMLATMPGGITQYDTFPWHTRLGASIHHLRQSGLAIETKREGPYRHGRYRLLTAGSLIIQAETAEAGQ